MELKELQNRAVEIRKKYAFLETKKYGREWTTAEIMEGFVGDVGDLMKLVMAKSGVRHKEDIDEHLAHELSDCLWCVLVLAHRYGVDIESEFLKSMNALEEQISNDRRP